jgi:signal transduction histidine kinase
MPSNMGLSNKITWALGAGLLIIIMGALWYSPNFRAHPQVNLKLTSQTDSLLMLADSTVNNAPQLSGKAAAQALKLAQAQHDSAQIGKAWLIMGKLKGLSGNNEEALSWFSKAGDLATIHHLYDLLCKSLIYKGENIYDQGHYDSALADFTQARDIAVRFGYRSSLSYALYYIGKFNETKGNFTEARKYYDTALSISRTDKDLHQYLLILPSRGKNYISEGKLDLALQCYLDAFHLSEQLHDQVLYAETSSHLGSLYLQMGLYDKALMYDKIALECRGDLDNPEGIAKSCNNIALVFQKLGNTDSAFAYFDRALSLCRSVHYTKGMVKALNNMGYLYSQLHEDDKAIRLLDSAYVLSDQTGYEYGLAGASLILADIYNNAHEVSKALSYYQLSLSKLGSTGYDDMLSSIYKGLYECYNRLGDYKSALAYHVALLETEKKLLNVENARQLTVLNVNFDLERKEKDNQVLRADNELKELSIKRKTTFIWLVVIALSFTCLLCLYVYNRLYVKKLANRQLENLNNELEKANQEKDHLFSIIAHELRNPLYWFQNLSEVLSKKYREMPADKVQKSLSALDESAKNAFHLMDNLLQWSRSKLGRIHPKKTEHTLIELVADTADMYQTILQYKEIDFTIDIDPGILVCADADLLGCVIRNLLSNAIKYTPASGTIHASSKVQGQEVTIMVTDSGTGIPESEIGYVFSSVIVSRTGLMQEKGSGIGLKLCKDFVEMNGGRIWVDSVEGSGTRFYFTVPLSGSLLPENVHKKETTTARMDF